MFLIGKWLVKSVLLPIILTWFWETTLRKQKDHEREEEVLPIYLILSW